MPNPHFDPRTLGEVSGNDVEFERELLTDYLRDTERLLGAQRAAAEAGDVKALERGAHSMKGASRAVGAAALGQIGHDIERFARDRQLERAVRSLDRAVREFDELRVLLEQHLRRLAA